MHTFRHTSSFTQTSKGQWKQCVCHAVIIPQYTPFTIKCKYNWKIWNVLIVNWLFILSWVCSGCLLTDVLETLRPLLKHLWYLRRCNGAPLLLLTEDNTVEGAEQVLGSNTHKKDKRPKAASRYTFLEYMSQSHVTELQSAEGLMTQHFSCTSKKSPVCIQHRFTPDPFRIHATAFNLHYYHNVILKYHTYPSLVCYSITWYML